MVVAIPHRNRATKTELICAFTENRKDTVVRLRKMIKLFNWKKKEVFQPFVEGKILCAPFFYSAKTLARYTSPVSVKLLINCIKLVELLCSVVWCSLHM